MTKTFLTIHCFMVVFANLLYAQSVSMDKNNFEPVSVSASIETILAKKAIRVIKDSSVKEVDEPTFVKIRGIHFKNGIIEVKVLRFQSHIDSI
jgi:hypothetical protein